MSIKKGLRSVLSFWFSSQNDFRGAKILNY